MIKNEVWFLIVTIPTPSFALDANFFDLFVCHLPCDLQRVVHAHVLHVLALKLIHTCASFLYRVFTWTCLYIDCVLQRNLWASLASCTLLQ